MAGEEHNRQEHKEFWAEINRLKQAQGVTEAQFKQLLQKQDEVLRYLKGNGQRGLGDRVTTNEVWRKIHTWLLGGLCTGFLVLVGWLLVTTPGVGS